MVNDPSKIPTPTYEHDIALLKSYYEKALREVSRELSKLSLTDFQRAQVLATQGSIKEILGKLDKNAIEWVGNKIPIAATDGVALSLVSLGLAESLEEARKIVKFNRLNRDFIETAIADTQSDLLQISQNVERKVRIAIRQATAETMRANLTRGINGTQSLKQDILSRLDESTKTGIIDAAGRRWNPATYAETVVRTKMSQTQRETAINEGVSRGVKYGIISRHNAIDACSKWEGKIVSLSHNGDYPHIYDLPRREIFHPNCKHVVTPIRRPDRLPEYLQILNGLI